MNLLFFIGGMLFGIGLSVVGAVALAFLGTASQNVTTAEMHKQRMKEIDSTHN